jgi:hypothetical protein
MVNFSLHKIGAAFIAALFFFTTYSQNNPKTEFEVFKDYKRLGYTVRPVFYSKATINRKFGDYELINKKTFNFNFGFDYLIHPERKWAFKSGLHLDIVPLYNIEFDIKEGDIWSGYEGYQEDSNIYKLNFTIPLLVQFKKQMAYNLFFNLEMGFHFMIMQQGGFDVTYLFSNEELSESREIFAMYGNATKMSLKTLISLLMRSLAQVVLFGKAVILHQNMPQTEKQKELLLLDGYLIMENLK